MFIYGRWGDLLYHTNDKDLGWNGENRSGEKESGIYVYVFKVKYLGEDGNHYRFTESGDVSLFF